MAVAMKMMSLELAKEASTAANAMGTSPPSANFGKTSRASTGREDWPGIMNAYSA
jgi:hypothetical protein